MNFILRASSRGSLEFLSVPPDQNDEFQLSCNAQREVSCTLGIKGRDVLVSCASKLQVSIFCDYQVFVCKELGGDFLVSSSMDLLVTALGKIIPSIDYFVDYISCGATPRVSTPFEGIFFLPPGSTLEYSSMHIDVGQEIEVAGPEFLDALEEKLIAKVSGVQNVMLEYSGGLESSILLHSLLGITRAENLSLIHLTDSGSGQVDDLQRVKKLAAKYSCHLTILNAEELKPFQVTTCSNIRPSFPHPGLVNIGYIDFSSDLLYGKNTALFNGAGGDSIFSASPQKGLPVELLKKGNLLGAFRNAHSISSYLRAPMISIFAEAYNEFKEMKLKLRDPSYCFAKINSSAEVLGGSYVDHTFEMSIAGMPRCSEVSVRERHLNAAINRYEMQSSPLAGYAGHYVYPFLAPDILSIGLATPSVQLLKGRIDRYSIRKRAADRYNSDEFWYRRKGGVAGLTQRCFSLYKSEIKNLVSEGYLVRAGMVNVDNVSRLIDEVAAGVVKCPGALINLFTANIYIAHWKDHVDEF